MASAREDARTTICVSAESSMKLLEPISNEAALVLKSITQQADENEVICNGALTPNGSYSQQAGGPGVTYSDALFGGDLST
jgi:hypothetical protein